MEATPSKSRIGGRSVNDLLATRNGALTIAVVSAILAGILLFVFVHDRSNSSPSSEATTVFVARSFIHQGSPAGTIASQGLLGRATVRNAQVQSGAIADPAVLHGEIATENIYPGQQITTSDFTTSTTIASQLTGSERAMAVPVEATHGLIGYVHTGEYVEVLASYSDTGGGGTVTKLLSEVLVLSVPSAATSSGLSGSSSTNIVLRVSEKEAPALAHAADYGKVWIALRPPVSDTSSGGYAKSSGNP